MFCIDCPDLPDSRVADGLTEKSK